MGNTYAFSDLHGHLDLYKKIKEYVKPEDKLYCLGDCGDRGPEPWETIKAVAQDKQIIYLKGNHEDMLVKAVREAMDGYYGCEKQRLLASNGGFETLAELLGEDRPEIWISMLAKLPTHIAYTNKNGQKIFLCHAGCSLWADEPEIIPNDHDLVWDRVHYFDNCRLLGPKIVVHGHTPIKYLASEIGIQPTTGALKYADGKKYCIDPGTAFTGRSILLNLDTFESIEFKL
jgi:serine/threonine protein phosphatase 1